jgi:hypothetical protein
MRSHRSQESAPFGMDFSIGESRTSHAKAGAVESLPQPNKRQIRHGQGSRRDVLSFRERSLLPRSELPSLEQVSERTQ